MALLNFIVTSVMAAGLGLFLYEQARHFTGGNRRFRGNAARGPVATQKQFTDALVQVLTASPLLDPATLEARTRPVLRKQGRRFAPGSYFRQRLTRLVRSGRLLRVRKGRGYVYFLAHERF